MYDWRDVVCTEGITGYYPTSFICQKHKKDIETTTKSVTTTRSTKTTKGVTTTSSTKTTKILTTTKMVTTTPIFPGKQPNG